jgi:hypothetical protein
MLFLGSWGGTGFSQLGSEEGSCFRSEFGVVDKGGCCYLGYILRIEGHYFG